MYVLMLAAALLVDSVCSGVSCSTTPALIGLMILQSAADTPWRRPRPPGRKPPWWRPPTWSRPAADAGALDELEELLLHPAIRAPPTARTATTERDERWNISATSGGWSGTKRCIS